MPNSDFVHLHLHTHYSIQDALIKPQDLVKTAKEMGFVAVAVTDHGKMASHVEFVDAAHKSGIKPILGCEFYLAKDRHEKGIVSADSGKKQREKLTHLTVLAMNKAGYKNLLALGYEASKPECYYYTPRIDFEYLSQHHDGLIVLSGCMGSELNQTLLKQGYEAGMEVAKKYQKVFGDRYYIELQYHGIEEQRHNLPLLVTIAKELDIPMVATNDVHYLAATDWKLHDVLLQMRDLRDNKTAKGNGKREAYKTHQYYLKSYDEMHKIFGEKVPEALTNTKLLADRVEDFYEIDLPHSLPEGKVDMDDKKFLHFWHAKLSHYEPKEAYLAYLGFKGLNQLGLDKNPEYVKRLKYEIETVWFMDVTDYFLIQKEMVEFMKSHDILFGVRGSGVGSLLNYCLGISTADPIKWGLMFERFLNPGRGTQYYVDLEGYKCENPAYDNQECVIWAKQLCKDFLEDEKHAYLEPRISREIWILENQGMLPTIRAATEEGFTLKNNASHFVCFYPLGLTDSLPDGELQVKKISSLPDIDTDIDDSRREEVIEWAKQRFGEENVKAVGTWGTYAAKAAILGTLKTSAKFQKQYSDNLAQMALKISGTIPKRPNTTIDVAIKESEDFAYWAKKFPEETRHAANLSGTISNLGVHAAAIVVSKYPIHEVVPVENSKGTLCTAFDMVNVERTGTVKYDYLGLATYQQIALAKKLIKERHDVDIDLTSIPLDDAKVFSQVFKKGNTISVFQFSSAGMQKALKEIKASTVNDLIAVAALYRPGPMEFIPDYARGKFNPQTVRYMHPLIEKHLSNTYGIMVYQEQAMFLAREMAALSWGEVDYLRKAISKKSGQQFNEACQNFSKKAIARGVPADAVNEVLHLMSKFGGYAFNKSHSCMYAIVAYWTGYLKTYYPAEWMAACMETDKDDTDKIEVYLMECERLGVKVMAPSVNESKFYTRVAQDGTVYMPINSLKGIGSSGQSIVDNMPYENLQDFVERSGCNKSLYMALAAGGALDCLTDSDADEEFYIDFWLEYAKSKAQSKKQSAQKTVNNNSLSLLEMRTIVQNKDSAGTDLLSMLDGF